MTARSIAIALLLSLLSSCGPAIVEPTQVVVKVTSDLGDALAQVDTALYDSREQQASDMQSYGLPDEVALPFTFAIVPAPERPASTVLVVVTGRDAQGSLLAQAKALVSFQRHRRLFVTMSLLSACLQRECGQLQTCTVSQANVGSCTVVEEPSVTDMEPYDSSAASSESGIDGGGGRGEPSAPDGSVVGGTQLNLDGGVDATTTDRDAMADGNLDGGRQVDAGPVDSGTARDSAAPNDGGSDGGVMDAAARDAGSTLEASVQDAASVSSFPRLDETPVIAMTGQYEVISYSEGLGDPAFANPLIYYPRNATPPFAAVVVMQAFLLTRSSTVPWANFLASHGIVGVTVDTTSSMDGVPERADDIEAQVRMIRGEHTRAGSPLQGKLDPSRIGVLGWSMGGSAALLAANRSPTLLRAVSAFQPWTPNSGVSNFPQVTAPTLVFAGAMDGTAAPADYARPYYESLTAPKAYFELAGLGHAPPAADATKAPRIILAWFKVYLESDNRYETYISGTRFQDVFSQISFFTSDR